MKCQNCGADLEDGVLFCRECGTKVQRTKRFCRECGSELAAGAKFCSACGARTDIVETNMSGETGKTADDSAASYRSDSVKASGFDRVPGVSNVREKLKGTREDFQAKKKELKEKGRELKSKVPTSGINSSNLTKLIIPIGCIFFVIMICALLLGRGGTSNSHTTPELVEVLESQAVPVKDLTIEKGSEYAYMSGEATVYIATAVSDSIIKIERWGKNWLPDKAVKYEDDIGSYKINDPANGFSWIDDEHTAFNITFQDKNHSGMKKAHSVVFTIDISDSDICKGTNYNERIRSYLYRCDDWHIYRAIALTDNLIKVERWQRSDSFSWTPFLFARDLWFINPDETTTDFEWTDDEHTAFTITIQDEENKFYWKNKAFTVFELENKKADYKTVSDYLNKVKEPVAGNDARPQRDGFSSNNTVSAGLYEFTIPTYWQPVQKSDYYLAYAETGGKVAALSIHSEFDKDDPVGFEWFDTEEKRREHVDQQLKGQKDYQYISDEIIETDVYKGVLWKYRMSYQGLEATCYELMFPSEEDNNWVAIEYAFSDNTDYQYDNDLHKIIASIRKKQSEGNSEITSEGNQTESESEESAPEELSTTEAVQIESSEIETIAEKPEMPLIPGISLESVSAAASDLGLSNVAYDEDFGHGTKQLSINNGSRSQWTIWIDIIYSTSSKEVLAASVGTMPVVSSEEQQNFIQGIAKALCPPAEADNIEQWVKSNIGTNAATTIDGITYELAVGPNGNLLFDAGINEWEDWDISMSL